MSMAVPIPEIGAVHRGRVVKLFSHGALLELECGYKGLLHRSHISWVNSAIDVSNEVRFGDEFEVVVLKTTPPNAKGVVFIQLGHRQLKDNPWDRIAEIHPVGSRVRGIVLRFLPFGALLEFPSGFRGLVHAQELSWTEKKAKPEEILRLGEAIEVNIVSVDSEKRKIFASYRQLLENPWQTFLSHYPLGSATAGRVVSVKPYGAFVMLSNGCIGLLHNSRRPPEADPLAIGDGVRVIIQAYDEALKRIEMDPATGD